MAITAALTDQTVPAHGLQPEQEKKNRAEKKFPNTMTRWQNSIV